MTHRHTGVRIRVTRARVALAALAVTVVATGSIGWAAIGDGGTVQGCVANNGTIDAIDPVTQACKDRQTPVEWYTKAGADAAFVGISGKPPTPTKLDGRDSSEFAPTLITTDVFRVRLPIDVDTDPVVCFTGPIHACEERAGADRLMGVRADDGRDGGTS